MAGTILLVKTSSLGDVLHLLPALTDAHHREPGRRFHWLVEEAFAEIPAWHPAVERVIPVALRRWRGQPLRAVAGGEVGRFVAGLRRHPYERIIDAQGLLKSALLTRLARGERIGLDAHSAREPVASRFYQRTIPVPRGAHAVTRLRRLLAAVLDYPCPEGPPDYGIRPPRRPDDRTERDGVVFLHGTTWPSKHWPEPFWRQLAALAAGDGVPVALPWGNDRERARAEAIARAAPDHCRVTGRMDLTQLAALLAGVRGVVAVDSGLGHLAAALGTPGVHLYGPTDPGLTGAMGVGQVHLGGDCRRAPCLQRTCPLAGDHPLQPPCFRPLTPERVWNTLRRMSAPPPSDRA